VNPNYQTPDFTVIPDNGTKKLRLLFPNETAAPGTVAGKSGTPQGPASDNHFIAGTTVTIRVDGTDTWGNILLVNKTITLTTDDPYDAPDPQTVTLSSGTTTYTHVYITERTSDIGETTAPSVTITTASTFGYTDQSVSIAVDDDDTVRNLQILIQGETPVPGSSVWPNGGKIGQPDGDPLTGPIDNFVAGATFTITMRVVDNYFNLVENPQAGLPLITLYVNDTNVSSPIVSGSPMPAGGIWTGSVALRTKNLVPGWVFNSTGTANGFGFNNHTSSNVKVDAGALARLQILVPGETPVQGSVTGKTGAPSVQTAGVLFNIPGGNIRAVDQYFNNVSTNGAVIVTMRDTYGIPQSQGFSLSGGVNSSPVPITPTRTGSPVIC
jgi:hypothetical protein